VKRRSLGRRRQDRKWPRHVRDFWMLAITGLVVYALSVFSGTQDSQQTTLSRLEKDRQALCTLRADLRERVNQGQTFLASHPHGLLGIPAGTLRVSIANQQHTLTALQPLDCRGF
jgi:hypothetical protein